VRARLVRYALYQVRDYAVERGIHTFLIGIVLFFPILLALFGVGSPAQLPDDMLRESLSALLPMYGFIAVVIGVNGIISGDRQRGYFRFLFAKPVSPIRYYLQAFIVNGIGTIAMTALLVLCLAALAGQPFPWHVLSYVGLYWLSAGGVGFLLSAVTRFDWIALAVVWWMAQLLRTLAPMLDGWYHDVLHVLLPPAHLMSQLAENLARGASTPMPSLLWVAGYGALCTVLGLAALRLRPLAP
jgi:hypothetical protein